MIPLEGCPACESRRVEPYGTCRDLRLVRCRACHLIYLDPQPVSRVKERYLHQHDLAVHFGEVEDRKRVLFSRRLSALEAPPAGGRLCDVGCGDGLFLQMAAAQGWEPFGIEMNPPAADAAERRGATILRGELEEIRSLPLGSFDLVCSWDAIEHTPTPALFAERIAGLAHPDGGRVILTTLNTSSLVARVTGMRWGMIVDEHFTYWNERSLTELLSRSGLTVLRVGFFGLGRDLVRPMDRLSAALGRRKPSGQSAPGAGGSWDTRSVVLRSERIVNRLLDVSRLGVGIMVEARRDSSIGPKQPVASGLGD